VIKGVRKIEYLDLVFQNLRTAAFASVRPLIGFPLDAYRRDDTRPERPSPWAEFTEEGDVPSSRPQPVHSREAVAQGILAEGRHPTSGDRAVGRPRDASLEARRCCV